MCFVHTDIYPFDVFGFFSLHSYFYMHWTLIFYTSFPMLMRELSMFQIFCDITYTVTNCTENEAHRYGRFLCASLDTIMKWHSSKEIYNKVMWLGTVRRIDTIKFTPNYCICVLSNIHVGTRKYITRYCTCLLKGYICVMCMFPCFILLVKIIFLLKSNTVIFIYRYHSFTW